VLRWYDFLCPFCYVGQQRTAAGLPLNRPAHLPDTRRALAAAEWVRGHQSERFPELHQALFAAHFVLGEDLEDPAVIDAHARRWGIELAALHAALADDSAMAAVAEAETIGREHGVQGTPASLVAQRLIMGLPPAAEFERRAQDALQLPR